MINVIFLGGLFPEEIKSEIESKSRGVIQYAADALQWSIIEGLDNFSPNLRLINLPYIGSYPKRYSDFRINTFFFSHNSTSIDINVGFINLSGYKLFSRYYNAKKALKKVFLNQIIIIYAIHTPFIKAAIQLKKQNPRVKICLIVPDLPEFMSGSDNFIYSFLKKIERNYLDKMLNKVDAFVLLSNFMYEPLNIGNRPWVRVEGIFSSNFLVESQEKEIFKTILYSGTLAKRYGILNLLEAFSMIKDENFRLWICGEGDATMELDRMVKVDSRITNFGQIPRNQVLELQSRSTVLVNPRTSDGDFTKYSFPSKTMEYLASGTPCIIHRLKGIPEEYFDYCFVSDDESPMGLYKIIISVCQMDQFELDQFGEKAKRFILENKTPKKQCEKIYNMLLTLGK